MMIRNTVPAMIAAGLVLSATALPSFAQGTSKTSEKKAPTAHTTKMSGKKASASKSAKTTKSAASGSKTSAKPTTHTEGMKTKK